MVITREMVLKFIARNEPASMYVLVETGQYALVLAMQEEGLVSIIPVENDIDQVCLTDIGRTELAKISD